MAGMRTVRPRPLDVEERVPVFWAGREVPAQIKAIDRGALHQYLVASTPKSPTPKTGKKRRRTVRYQAPREVLLDSEGEEGGGVGQQQQPQKQQQGQQKSQKVRVRARPSAASAAAHTILAGGWFVGSFLFVTCCTLIFATDQLWSMSYKECFYL